jgi:hypothetical protein
MNRAMFPRVDACENGSLYFPSSQSVRALAGSNPVRDFFRLIPNGAEGTETGDQQPGKRPFLLEHSKDFNHVNLMRNGRY